MKFRIVGAHRDTGDDVQMTIDVADRAAAEKWADENSIMWSEITPQPVAVAQSNPIAKTPATTQRVLRAEPKSIPPTEGVVSHTTVNVPAGAPATVVAQTIVQAPKGMSGFGIASLVLGLFACLFCWIPLCGMGAIPIAVIGGILAIVGFLISAIGRKSSVGMPFAGGTICLLAIIIAVAVTGGSAKSIGDAIDAERQARARTNQTPVGPVEDGAAPASDTKQPGLNAAVPTKGAGEEWASGENAVRQGDIEVKVRSVTVGKVALKDAISGSSSRSKDDLIAIKLAIQNLSDSKKLNYRSWAGKGVSFTRDFGTLEDNFDNTYKRINFGFSTEVAGRTESDSIYPGMTIEDVLIFEEPIAKAEFLKLELPSENFGGTGMLRIKIPATMIQR